MGKHKKKKRDHSSDRSRSRSRSKHKKREYSDDESEGQIKHNASYFKFLSHYKHQYYLQNQSKAMGLPYVIWNLCIKLTSRPSTILIICESMSHLATIQRACRLQRNIRVIDQTSRSSTISQLLNEKAEVILTTQKKCSIIVAVEEQKNIFDAVINVSRCFDNQFYAKTCELAKQGSSIVIVADGASSIRKLSESIGVQFEENECKMNESYLEKEMISDVQLAPNPTSQTFELLKNMGISFEEAAGRLLQLEKRRRQPPKSLHLGMPGYITYRLDMDVEFNSLKYVWNFLREEFPRSLYEAVRGMHKYQNERGVVINVPEELRYVAETVAQKLKRHKSKFKGIQLEECIYLPKLEDTQSQEYKIMRDKKKYAIQNKHELEIFIGGVPYEMEEHTLKDFFKEKGVNLFLVRILKDQKGFSKGIGFGLCQNNEHFEKAIQLNGSRFMDRTIRVKLADQRKN